MPKRGRRIDERPPEARRDVLDPSIYPLNQSCARDVVRCFDIEHGRQLAGHNLGQEELRLFNRVNTRMKEMIRTPQQSRVARTRPIRGKRLVLMAGAFGSLDKREDLGGGDLLPVDLLLVPRDVNALDIGFERRDYVVQRDAAELPGDLDAVAIRPRVPFDAAITLSDPNCLKAVEKIV